MIYQFIQFIQFNRFKLLRSICILILVIFGSHAFADQAEVEARFIHQRLTGKFLRADSPLFVELAGLIRAGRTKEAVERSMEDPAFVSSTTRRFASQMLSLDQSSNLPLSDSVALVMGSIRDNLDARLLLTGNYIYGGDSRLALGYPAVNSNDLFDRLDTNQRELSSTLAMISPQWRQRDAEFSGIFTTRYWASVNYFNGTNRRVVPNAFASFLCQTNWRRPNLPTDRIRRDIDRFPQQNPRIFQKECRSCHGVLDPLSGAFAKINFAGNSMTWVRNGVAPKMVQHADVYPEGFVPSDDTWINPINEDIDDSYGWSSPPKGSGIASFGALLANSRAFGECMTKRVVREICKQDLSLRDPFVQRESRAFMLTGYRWRELFKNVIQAPECK